MMEPDLPPDDDMSAPEAYNDLGIHKCEAKTPGRCIFTAVLRARMYEHGGEEHEMDLCDKHADEAGAQYPDCIKTVKEYKHGQA